MIKKFTSILFAFALISFGNFALANQLDCSKVEGITGGRSRLDEGVFEFSSALVNASNEACIEAQIFADSAMKFKGWAWNDNLGWFSFRAENEDTDQTLENRGIELGSQIEYGVDAIYSPEPMSPDKYDLVGYGWGDNIGWIKFNCLANTSYAYDVDDCANNNYGVSLVLNEDTGLHEFQGSAYSEVFDDFIDFTGLSVDLLLSDLDFTPTVSLRERPSQDQNVYANNVDGYYIDVSFFDSGNLNKTQEFDDSELNFCIIFEDNRKLDLSDPDQPVVEDCGAHDSSRRYPDNLNVFTSETRYFTFASSRYSSDLLSSLIPTDTVFKISKIKVYGLGYERFFDLDIDLVYDNFLDFAVRTTPSITSSAPSINSCFNSNVNYNWNFGENDAWFCSRLKTQAAGFTYDVNLDFTSTVSNYTPNINYYQYPPDFGPPKRDVPADLSGLSTNIVKPIYFNVPSINNVNLLDLNLGLAGVYVLDYKGSGIQITRPLPEFSDLNSENYEGVNIDGVVSGSNINISDSQVFNTSTTALRSKVRERIDVFKSRKLKCELTLQLNFADCLSDFQNGVYEIQSSTISTYKAATKISKFFPIFESDPKSVVVLKDIQLIIDQNVDFNELPGIVLISSDDRDVHVYVSNEVTDIKAHMFVDGFIFPYSNSRNLAYLSRGMYERVIDDEYDASNYNEILLLGSFRSKNCIGCKDELPPRNPDGSLASNYESKLLHLFDFNNFRKSPLEFNLTQLGNNFYYESCDQSHLSRGNGNGRRRQSYSRNDVDTSRLCRRSTVNGRQVKVSQNEDILIESDFNVMYSTNFVYRTPLKDMPIFRK
jgi:hypothetical protein